MEILYDPVAENEESYLEIVFRKPRDLARESEEDLADPLGALHLRPAVCVVPTTPLREVIQRMKEQNVGSVLIENRGVLAGIFTERDLLMKVVGENLNIDDLKVADVMNADPETLSPSDAISFAINMMSDGGYRHVPVTDIQGRPLHVVSVRDLASWLADCHPESIINASPHPGQFASRRNGG